MSEKTATAEEIAKSILDQTKTEMEKRGAKMSAANKESLGKCMKSMQAAGDYFGKAATAHPDDENISNGVAHHTTAMSHLSKLASGIGDTGGDSDDKKPGDAASPAKAAEIDDLKKSLTTEFTKQIEGVKTELEKKLGEATEKAHKLEIENVRLTTQLETLGSLPIKPKAFVGVPVDKGAHAAAIANAATGNAEAPKIEDIKPGDPAGFNKALASVRANPQPMRALKADQAGA